MRCRSRWSTRTTLDAGDLKSKFDVLVFVGGAIRGPGGFGGRGGGGGGGGRGGPPPSHSR